MKHLLKSITNSSTLLSGYSYDRSTFRAGHVWTRSLISGAVSASLTAVGVYSGVLAMDAQFAASFGEQALNFKMAAGAVTISLLGYSLRDLAGAVIRDVKTQMRVARANSWLMKGIATTHDYSHHIHMQQTPLSMVRFVEVEGGIKVYAIAKHPENEQPVLLDVTLYDEEYPALAIYYTHAADIRSSLNESCGEFSEAVAKHLGIKLSPAAPLPQKTTHQLEDEPLQLDEELLNELSDHHDGFSPLFARASAPRQRGEALRAVSQVPPEAITH
ncbi:hypothetical protein NPS53_09065 [Pseudomonas putida]|uniref:hypothetical protein n=1 Tax=Pseudomonas putida TaxID=303 RepID=UPI0023635696|nr:hypothetical protein [Pseudomonas putida]MDD2139725.1 hypothetical protein [Pseudomonas putida]HDS1721649.1 hypothetical protein [Pseudomonas putida]